MIFLQESFFGHLHLFNFTFLIFNKLHIFIKKASYRIGFLLSLQLLELEFFLLLMRYLTFGSKHFQEFCTFILISCTQSLH